MSTRIRCGLRICFMEGCHVCKDYAIKDDQLCTAGEILETYNPTQHTELPEALAKVKVGDTEALLQFVRTYGDFGYKNLEESRPEDHGEPLPWIWAHIRTIKLCLELQRYLYEQQEAWKIDDYLDKYRTQPRSQDTHIYEISIAIKGYMAVMRLTRKQHERIYDFAQTIRHEIIQRNTKELTYDLQRVDGKTQPRLEFAGLIEVVYWHLEQMEKENKPVRQCEWCESLFIVQRRNQRFCPHPTEPKKESPCAINHRQWKHRQEKRKKEQVSTP